MSKLRRGGDGPFNFNAHRFYPQLPLEDVLIQNALREPSKRRSLGSSNTSPGPPVPHKSRLVTSQVKNPDEKNRSNVYCVS